MEEGKSLDWRLLLSVFQSLFFSPWFYFYIILLCSPLLNETLEGGSERGRKGRAGWREKADATIRLAGLCGPTPTPLTLGLHSDPETEYK